MMDQNDCAGCGLMTRVSRFIMAPITSTASDTSWFLFVGLILIAVFLWTRILRDIRELM
jgi:hypothetical protein